MNVVACGTDKKHLGKQITMRECHSISILIRKRLKQKEK
jgi:hypothetical protein